MRSIKFIFSLFLLSTLLFSCEEENMVEDQVFEFVFLETESISVAESTEGNSVEINAEMLAFDPRNEDVVVTVEVSSDNAVEGVDFELTPASKTITIPAGSFSSSTGLILTTLNNGEQQDLRHVNITITSASDESLNIGKGLGEEVTQKSTLVTITDDDCSDDITIFDGTSVSGTTSSFGYDPFTPQFDVMIDGDQLTLLGPVSDYFGNDLTLTIVPNEEDPARGTLVFEEEMLGDAGDGAIYHLIPTPGEISTYDACAQKLVINSRYEWNYEQGAGWEFWYDATFELTID